MIQDVEQRLSRLEAGLKKAEEASEKKQFQTYLKTKMKRFVDVYRRSHHQRAQLDQISSIIPALRAAFSVLRNASPILCMALSPIHGMRPLQVIGEVDRGR